MPLLPDHKWKLKYTPDDGNLVQLFYVPALEAANRYHRSTGYFGATALTLAAGHRGNCSQWRLYEADCRMHSGSAGSRRNRKRTNAKRCS